MVIGHIELFFKNVKKLKEIKCNNVKIANCKKNLEQILYILSSVLIFFKWFKTKL